MNVISPMSFRIRTNSATAKAPTGDDTPATRKSDTGFIDSAFFLIERHDANRRFCSSISRSQRFVDFVEKGERNAANRPCFCVLFRHSPVAIPQAVEDGTIV